MQFSAPAKVNLSFSILGKRSDGFHEIESLMAPLTLADTLEIEPGGRDGIAFSCNDPSIPSDDGNLVVRAARRFFETTGKSPSVAIRLEKRIPHGAGLGGGSSDAATTLLALNQLSGNPLGGDEIHRLAAEIGSDVPFFLAGGAAVCRGRGEIVTPRPLPVPLPLLLIKPGFGVPTPWAYGQWKESKELPGISYQRQEFPWGELVNDLERPVFEKYLILAILKRWLLEQPECAGALMSGSGSTSFAILREEADGPVLERRIKQEFGEFWTRPCQTV